MRIANEVHLRGPWRIGPIVHDFRLEDAWDLPAVGERGDFQRLIDFFTALDPASGRRPGRILWEARRLLGRWLNLDPDDAEPPLPIPGTEEPSLLERLPDDLRGTADGVAFEALPFVPLYRTETEFAAEISNKTVHGVLHLGWVGTSDGPFTGRLGVFVKPRGRLGAWYMRLIAPFRHLLVYPGLMRGIARAWRR